MNHKQTSKHEIDGGYLWSPKTEKNGNRSQFYDNLRRACPGDSVISFAFTKAKFIGRVDDYALASPRPPEFGTAGENWLTHGWLLPVSWTELETEVRPKDLLETIGPLLPQKYSPINAANGNGNQKAYLAEISLELFDVIVQEGGLVRKDVQPFLKVNNTDSQCDLVDDRFLRSALEDLSLDSTERLALTKARYGQGEFRRNVFRFGNRCIVTGVTLPSMLIASHIKPWRSCESAFERLDGNNGVLLTPNLDKLFDRGYISFLDDGAVIRSFLLTDELVAELNLQSILSKQLRPFRVQQRSYLEFHRENVFIQESRKRGRES